MNAQAELTSATASGGSRRAWPLSLSPAAAGVSGGG